MFKKLFSFFKRVVFYMFLLYSFNVVVSPIAFNIPINLFSFNLVAAPMGIIVPINLITVSSLVILGVPALFGLIVILVL